MAILTRLFFSISIKNHMKKFAINFFNNFHVLGAKQVMTFRNFVIITDDDGNSTKYKRIETPMKRHSTNISRRKIGSKAKTSKSASKTVKKSNCEELAAMLPKCTVKIARLSKSEMKEKLAKLERERKIRLIKDEIKSMPRK